MTVVVGILLKATVLVAAAGLAAGMLRRASASTRHAIWAVALAGSLLLPAADVLLPKIQLPVLSDDEAPMIVEAPRDVPTASASAREPRADVQTSMDFQGTAMQGAVRRSFDWAAWVIRVWVLGSLLIWGRLLVGTWAVRRLTRRAARATPELHACLSELSCVMKVGMPVRLRLSDARIPPMTFGIVRHTILLPEGARDWPPDRRRVVLAHELAHIRRRDGAVQLLAQAASILYWCHPLVWYAVHRLAVERERASDDRVLALPTPAEDYAEHLVGITRGIGAGVSLATLTMARSSRLETRILAILDPATRRQAVSRFAVALAACLAAGLTLSATTMRLTRAPSEIGMSLAVPPPPAIGIAPALRASLVVPPSQEPGPVSPFALTIEGSVVDTQTGEGLEGVQLFLAGSTEATDYQWSAFAPERMANAPYVAITDADGSFTIRRLTPGRYRVIPILRGWAYARPDRIESPVEPGSVVEVDPGATVDGVEIGMLPAATISGRITDGPVLPYTSNWASVRLMRYTYDEAGRRVLATAPGTSQARVYAEDTYRFYGVQPGEYYVRAYSRGSEAFYPGTPDESEAVPVRIEPGQELDLGPMMLDVEEERETTDVRFHLTDVAGRRTLFDTERRAVFDEEGTVFSTLFSWLSPPSDQIVVALPMGSHDGLVTWSGSEGLSYSFVSLDVGDSDIDMELASGPPIHVTGGIFVEDAAGRRSEASGVYCVLASRYLTAGVSRSSRLWLASPGPVGTCLDQDLIPGTYTLDVWGMEPDQYVASATASGHDMLAGPIDIDASVDLEIVAAGPGAVIEGTVAGEAGEALAAATVVLVPDPPLRDADLRYRFAVSDGNGEYRLRGIAPGRYRLFAWSEIEGMAWRNADFLSGFEDRGVPIVVEGPDTMYIDPTAF